jgi:hypothetical protein
MSMDTHPEIEQIPSPEDFLLRTPLYKRFPWPTDPEFGQQVWRRVGAVLGWWRPIDAFCPGCGRESIFQDREPAYWPGGGTGQPELPTYLRPGAAPEIHQVSLTCNRDKSHTLVAIFRVGPDAVTKIGQYPSLADLAQDELREYRRALGGYYSEFRAALRLAAHGVGVGAFVYLRRVFEHLLKEAEAEGLQSGAVTAEALEGARRTDEKISLLAELLPPLLVDNRGLYGILSKGLHELTDEECRAHFGVVRAGIEIILEDKVHHARREQRARQVRQEVEKLRLSLKNADASAGSDESAPQ